MKTPFKIFASILLVILVSACNATDKGNPTGTPANNVETIVASTLTALARTGQQTPQVSFTPSATATVSKSTFTPTPTRTLTPAVSLTPTITPVPKPGTIAGTISGYPYGSVPGLVVVVYQQEAPNNYAYFITTAGSTYFSIDGEYVIPGTWQVVAYDSSGNSGGCTAMVKVKSEETVTCDITDWVSPFRAKPADVQNP